MFARVASVKPRASVERTWTTLAKYYDVIYHWKNYRRESETIHRIVQRFTRSPGSDLLDVACGTGSHIVHLRRHYHVMGVDRSPAMLRVARRKCPEVRFAIANMLDLELGRTFDVITCLFSSIAYARTYRNLRRAFASFAQHLKPGGVVVVEPFFGRRTYSVGRPYALFVDRPDVKIARLNVSHRRGNVAILDFHYLIAAGKGVQYLRDAHGLGLFEAPGVLQVMRATGFRATFLRHGLMPGRGLYIGVKE